MSIDAIRFFNRYTQQVEEETIYGESFLRWTYGNPVGRVALHTLVKRSFFSRCYGWLMDRPESRAKILPFITRYGLKASEFLESVESFTTFNQFFFRKLQPDARPIAPSENVAVFPADGRHLAFSNFSNCQGLFVKGQVFTLEELVDDIAIADRYRGGSALISRLCPVDYHRFHFPLAGVPSTRSLIDGPLMSVNPIALSRNIRILSTNRRCRAELATRHFGRLLTVEVGATCVGGFCYTYTPEKPVEKGEEKGFFRFGGSLTITLFEPGKINFDRDLLENSAMGRETYGRMGDQMGVRLQKTQN